MEYDYSKLEGKIIEVFDTRGKFAEALDIGENTLSLKLNNKSPWTQPEINKSVELLNIPDKDLHMFFFTRKVQKG